VCTLGEGFQHFFKIVLPQSCKIGDTDSSSAEDSTHVACYIMPPDYWL